MTSTTTGGFLATQRAEFLTTQAGYLLSTYNIASILPVLGETQKVPRAVVSASLGAVASQVLPAQLVSVRV